MPRTKNPDDYPNYVRQILFDVEADLATTEHRFPFPSYRGAMRCRRELYALKAAALYMTEYNPQRIENVPEQNRTKFNNRIDDCMKFLAVFNRFQLKVEKNVDESGVATGGGTLIFLDRNETDLSQEIAQAMANVQKRNHNAERIADYQAHQEQEEHKAQVEEVKEVRRGFLGGLNSTADDIERIIAERKEKQKIPSITRERPLDAPEPQHTLDAEGCEKLYGTDHE